MVEAKGIDPGTESAVGGNAEPISDLIPARSPTADFLNREISRFAPLGEIVLGLCWAVLSVFVFFEVPGTRAARVAAGLFTGLGGAVVLVVVLYRRVADRRIRQGLRDASVALQAIEAVTDPDLSFLDLDQLLDEVLERTRRLLNGDVASVVLLAGDQGSVEVRASRGAVDLIPGFGDRKRGEDVLAAVIGSRRGVVMNEFGDNELVREGDRSHPSQRRVSSLVAAPLLIRGEVMGAVEVASRQPHPFEQRDLRLLQIVADRCAASVERARLDEAERRSRLGAAQARRQLILLARASVSLSTALDSYEVAMENLADVVVPDFADWFSVDLTDEGGVLRRIAARPAATGPTPTTGQIPFPHRHPRGEQLVRRAIDTGRVQVVMPQHRDVHGGEPAGPGEYEEAQPAAGVESMLVIPVRVRGLWAGGLTFVTGAGRRGYRRSDLVTAEELAERVGVTIERVLAWRQTSQHERRLRTVVDASPLAIAELDLDGRARWWNSAANAMFGWREDDTAHTLPVQGGAQQVADSLWARTRMGEATLGTELTAYDPGGQQLELSVSTAPLDHQGEVTGILMVAGDITERRRLMDQFHQTERLTSMARMAGGLAHDFNNLLSVILGCCEALLRQLGAEPAVQEEVGAIQRASQRATAMTGQLLAIGHRRTVQPVVLDLNELVLSMQPMIGGVLGQRVELEIKPSGASAPVFVDQADLERAVLNLAINARDAMPDGGNLTLGVVTTGLTSGDHDDQLMGLVVSDTGVGMDPATKEHCLEPFFTTKGLARGTGLGLATVHATVTQAGGQLVVESSIGAGTTITLWLPAASADAVPAALAGGRQTSATAGSETILLVEDEPELRRLAERELRARGYTVRAAANATEALRIAQNDLAGFDVVVTDIVMPGMSGVELAQMLVTIAPGVPVLFVSGHIERETLPESVLAEGSDFLAKPFTPEQLALRVREICDRPLRKLQKG